MRLIHTLGYAIVAAFVGCFFYVMVGDMKGPGFAGRLFIAMALFGLLGGFVGWSRGKPKG